ncbi:MAG TPA: patatin-like phospholipase family protein [Polyangia bacterium]
MPTPASKTAVVLAGGVAKGAFEAGALDVLIERGVRMSQVVGASSGSLNATLLAAGIRAGRERDATQRLMELWRDDASWMRVFHVSFKDIVSRTGISDSSEILALVRREFPAMATAAVNPVRLRIVVAALRGVPSTLAGRNATTFEGVLSFVDRALDADADRELIYQAAAASSAFPLIFHPLEVDGLGPCYDGGAVNNTPIQLAAAEGLEEVILISPYPAVFRNTPSLEGVELVSRLVDILIHERVFRDLKAAESANATIARLEGLVGAGTLTREQLAAVLATLALRPLRILAIRPPVELEGNSFTGFLHKKLREDYIAAGRAAALAALAE